MKRNWKYWIACLAIAVGSALGARLLSKLDFFDLLNLKASDFHFIVRGSVASSHINNIVLVVADQKTLDTFPELQMFWHPYYAQAISAAGQAGAKVIGFDYAFGVPVTKWEPDNDQILAAAVLTSPVPVACAYVERLNGNQMKWMIPINLAAANLGLGAYVNLTTDPDNFIRRQELMEAPSPNPSDPPPARGMAMLLAEKYLGADAQYKNGQLLLAGRIIPTVSDRTIIINYAGKQDTFPRISLCDFIGLAKAGKTAELEKLVKGKAVLIGPADSVEDRYPTPFTVAGGNAMWNTAGVEIHANALRTILNGIFLLPAPEWARIIGLLLATSFVASFATVLPARRATLLLCLEVAAILVGTHVLFLAGRTLPTAELLVATLLGLIGSVVYRFATAEKRRDLFRRAVSLFVGKELTSELESKETIALSGKKMEVTILFTDIRGFTAFSEKVCDEQGPEVVVQLLNDYMGLMVSIIVRYHGQVNKFIGDGILAIFSDDDENSTPGDHAIRAVQCATDMVNAPSEFSTGAGLHTGPAVVGNVGSADKMEYTVLGDTVNLASRLESLNKENHTKLLMSGTTQAQLGDKVETVHLKEVPVRGKTVPIHLYTVASLVPAPETVHA